MNVDIVNILNKVYMNCDGFSASSLKGELDTSMKEIVQTDVLSFIEHISTNNKEERITNFSKEYLDWATPSTNDSKTLNVPKSVTLFRKYDSINNTHICDDLEELFTLIGKSYLLSKYDKKDIDKEKYLRFIAGIKHCKTDSKQIKQVSTTTTVKPKVTEPVPSEEESEVQEEVVDERTLEELLEDLNSLIGLNKVKAEVNKRINQIRVDKKREEAGLKKSSMSLHMVFTGNPGTGKTTVARKLAAIYNKLGVLSQGQFIEVDRGKLVGGYVGSTAIKTQEVIDQAIGGILFIDEAYTLTHGKGETDFGQEAVDTLLKAMEDKRDDFVVIVAGYTKEMDEFVKSNPGLESRFNRYIEFEDYTAEELNEIFALTCKKDEKIIDPECDEYLKQYFVDMTANKPDNFANGRTVRNYYENVIEKMNERLAKDLDSATKEDLQTIRFVDLQV